MISEKQIKSIVHRRYYDNDYNKLRFKMPTTLGGHKCSMKSRPPNPYRGFKFPGPGKYEITDIAKFKFPHYSFGRDDKFVSQLKSRNYSEAYNCKTEEGSKIRYQ